MIGIFYNSIFGSFTSGVDPNSLNDADVGKTFTFNCINNYFCGAENHFTLGYDDEDGYVTFYFVETPSEISEVFDTKCGKAAGTFEGVFKRADEDIRNIALSETDEYFSYLSDISEEFDYTQETQKEIHEAVSDYYIEVISVNRVTTETPRYIAYAVGVILLLAFCIRIIALLTRKTAFKVTAFLCGILLCIVLVAG